LVLFAYYTRTYIHHNWPSSEIRIVLFFIADVVQTIGDFPNSYCDYPTIIVKSELSSGNHNTYVPPNREIFRGLNFIMIITKITLKSGQTIYRLYVSVEWDAELGQRISDHNNIFKPIIRCSNWIEYRNSYVHVLFFFTTYLWLRVNDSVLLAVLLNTLDRA